MSISFSGLASGLDTSSWIESLTALKRAKVTTYTTKKEELTSTQETLNKIKGFFTSFRSMLERVTDARLGINSMDLFTQNIATSSNVSVLTATAGVDTEEATYNIVVDKLASNTSATSRYKYTTEIVESTIATGDSKLSSLGVHTGNLGVRVNGVNKSVNITAGDTINTFIDKLRDVGVDASYNKDTGLFNMNISSTDITENGTNIVNAFHLHNVNEGYKSSNVLNTTNTETIFTAATEDTKLVDLGVGTGTVRIKANGVTHNYVIGNNTTLGNFISALCTNNGENSAKLDRNGVLSIIDAEIVDEGGTNIKSKLGLTEAEGGEAYHQRTQESGNLKTKVTVTANATGTTNLGQYGISNTMTSEQRTVKLYSDGQDLLGSTVITETTSIDNLVSFIRNNGGTADYDDGILSIEGCYIENDALVSALGLNKSVVSSYALGSAKTITTTDTVDGNSKLGNIVAALGTGSAVSGGYNLSYNGESLSVSADTTLNSVITQINNKGGDARLDAAGRLVVVGEGLSGSVATALGITSTTDVETVSAGDKVFKTISTVAANGTTKFNEFMNWSSLTGTIMGVYDSEGTLKGTLTLSATSSINEMFSQLAEKGVTGTISNGVITLTSDDGSYVSGSLATALGITTNSETINSTVGLLATSSSAITYTTEIAATTSTLLKDLGAVTGGTANVLYINKDSDTKIGTITVNNTTTIGSLFGELSSYGITGSITDGVISLTSAEGAYVSGYIARTKLGIGRSGATSTITVGKSTTSSAMVTLSTTTTVESTYTNQISLQEIASNVASSGGLPNNVTKTIKAIAEALGYTWVTTAAELTAALNNNEDICLGADIDLDGVSWTSVSDYSKTFDGNGYTIRNLSINSSGEYVGLIGSTTAEAVVKNIRMENVNITGTAGGNQYVGAVIGTNYGTVENIAVVSGTVRQTNTSSTAYIGGVIGSNAGTVENIYNAAEVTGRLTGGIVGISTKNSKVKNCYNVGTTCTNNLGGGIVGVLNGSAINVYNSGNINGITVGGIVGFTDGTINYGYNAGSVTSNYVTAGGIAGHAGGNVTIAYCVNSSSSIKINGGANNGKGLVGEHSGISVTDSYYNNALTDTYGNGANQTSCNAKINTGLAFTGTESVIEYTNEMGLNTTLSSIHVYGTNRITIQDAGSTAVVTVLASDTVEDMLDKLSAHGITGNVEDGKLTLTGDNNHYITEISLNLKALLRISVGNGKTYYEKYKYSNTDSNTLTVSNTVTISNSDTLGEYGLASTGYITVMQNGTSKVVTVTTDKTVAAICGELQSYGIAATINRGKFSLSGTANSYIKSITPELETVLKLQAGEGKTYESSSQTLHSNSRSFTLKAVSTQVAAKTTALKDLKNSSNTGITFNGNNVSMTVQTTDGHVVRNYTLNFSKTSTLEDVIYDLASCGIRANVDSNGKFSMYTDTLDDFVIGGELGNYLLGSTYTKTTVLGDTTSTSSSLSQQVSRNIDRNTLLSDLGITNGNYIVNKNGARYTENTNLYTTVGDFLDYLNTKYGFDSSIDSQGRVVLNGNGESYLTTPETGNSNILTVLGLDDWTLSNPEQVSSVLKVSQENTVNADRTTLLSDINNISTGEYYIYQNGVKYTAFISSDETLGSFIDTLERFGMDTSLVDGKLTILGVGDSYIATSRNTANASDVVTKLFGTNLNSTYDYANTIGITTTEDTVTPASEETLMKDCQVANNGTFAGSLYVKVDDNFYTVRVAETETFETFINKLESLGLEASVSNGNFIIQSGLHNLEITEGTSHALSNLGIIYDDDLGGYCVSSEAVYSTTTNVVEKTLSVANYANMNTKLKDLNITKGDLTIYRNGEKATVTIGESSTFNSLLGDIQAKFSDAVMEFQDGYLVVKSNAGNVIKIGSTTDNTNFLAITGLESEENSNLKSSRELYRVNADSVLTTAGLFRKLSSSEGIREGTFTVGNATFTITSTTTMSDIISQINSNDDAQATAYWDNIAGKFVITSRKSGAALINVAAGSSNFTDIMGLTESTWNAVGDIESTSIDTGSQDIGTNARLSINGTYFTSSENMIGSDISRIKGLTINLQSASEGQVVTLKVERDKETLTNAVSEVVDAYNELMKNVDEAIAIDGKLHGQTSLKLIRNQLRSLMTSSISGEAIFKNLAAVGISVKQASANNISTNNIVAMEFDAEKFKNAFGSEKNALKDLLVGTNTNQGIFSKMEDIVERSLNAVTGYFDSTNTSINKDISRIDKNIEKLNKSVERYRASLEKKFSSMDSLIAKIQQQYTSFLGT